MSEAEAFIRVHLVTGWSRPSPKTFSDAEMADLQKLIEQVTAGDGETGHLSIDTRYGWASIPLRRIDYIEVQTLEAPYG